MSINKVRNKIEVYSQNYVITKIFVKPHCNISQKSIATFGNFVNR